MPDRSPVAVWTEPVQADWIDYNGHLSEAYYVLVLGHGTDAVMEAVGLGPEHRSAARVSLFTVEAHLRYLEQVGSTEVLEVRSWVVGSTAKLLWIWHELWAGGSLRATEEVLGLHVDADAGRAVAFSAAVAERIAAARVDPPEQTSRRILVG